MKRLTIQALGFKIRSALEAGKKGEILRVKTARERDDVLILKRVNEWDISTEKDGKEYRVIAA